MWRNAGRDYRSLAGCAVQARQDRGLGSLCYLLLPDTAEERKLNTAARQPRMREWKPSPRLVYPAQSLREQTVTQKA